jgi:cytochrome c-type biogenesis protein CcmE
VNRSTFAVGVMVLVLAAAVGLALLSARGVSAEDVLKATARTVIRAITPERPDIAAVDVVSAEPSRWRGQSVRLHGVARGVSAARGTIRFQLEGSVASVPVSHRGRVVSTFTEGAEVIVGGRLTGAGLVSDSILVKIP